MIEYDKGIHLRGTDLWFDAGRKAGFSFISSAAAEGFVPPEKVISTPETIRLIEKKIKKSVALACPYNRPFSLGNIRAELIPSGCMLGSSQIVIQKNDTRLIYTADINLGRLRTCEPACVRRCDILIMKCTYAAPKYSFPPAGQAEEAIIEFADRSLSSGAVPVILAEPPGKAAEIAKVLSEGGFGLSLHRSPRDTIKIYEEFGVTFPNYETFGPGKIEGRVLIFPPDKSESRDLEKIRNKNVAIIGEFAPEERERVKRAHRADEAFPFATSGDFDQLIQFVEFVRPGKLYLTHTYSAEFARILQKRGFNAVPLHKPTQLSLL